MGDRWRLDVGSLRYFPSRSDLPNRRAVCFSFWIIRGGMARSKVEKFAGRESINGISQTVFFRFSMASEWQWGHFMDVLIERAPDLSQAQAEF